MAFDKVLYQFFTETLTAGQTKAIEFVGNYAFLFSSTGTANKIQIAFQNQNTQTFPVGVVLKTQIGETFTRLIITNTDGASATISFALGNGDIDYKALVVANTLTTTPAQTAAGNFAVDVTTGAAALVFAAGTVKSVLLQADFANTAPVFLGFDNSVSATKKVIALSAGMAYEFTNYNGNIYAFSAAAQKLSVSSW